MENFENEHAFEDVQQEKYEPALGMLFDSHEKMFEFYKAYGKQEGFPVKKLTSKKGSDGILRYATFACGCSGKSKSKSTDPLKLKPIVKTSCDARIGGCRNEDGKWALRILNLQHNHELGPDKVRYFPCNRQISASVKKHIDMNDCAKISNAQNFNSIVVEVGGHENVSFLEKDCRNFVDKTRRLRFGEGDAMAILKYFQKKQAECKGFFYSIDMDAHDRLKNVFWADPRSRAAYKYFGDVITFDTTYLTNNYDMPLVPFVGVNHHGQSILLGCGLISHEDTDTFTWLFEAWLSCMSGSPPSGIITDQDKAMQKAVESVFPTTRHRWCLWHIMKKVPEKLEAFKEREGIISSLLSTVYDSLSPAVFEKAWHDMINTYGLWNNDWLNGLYDERYRWVPCYLKDSFWAGMSTTQRSESMNAFFDGFVNSKTNLKQFMKQYENALKRKVELEWQADARCFGERTPCVSRYEMEKQVEELYTISKFKEFQQELTALMYCDILDSMGSVYEISESFGQGQKRSFEVVFEKAECEVTCICSKFQFRGILCRHAIAVLIRNNVEVVPEKYILLRWRKDVRRCYNKVKVSYDVKNLSIQQERYDKMCMAFAEVADVAADNESCYKYVLDWMKKSMKDLPKQIRCENMEKTIIGEVSCGSNNIERVVNDLVTAHREGRLPYLRKQSLIYKKPAQKDKTAQKNEENTSSSYEVPNEISIQQSSMAMAQPVPPYALQSQPVPPYALQPHYSSPSMTYEESEDNSCRD